MKTEIFKKSSVLENDFLKESFTYNPSDCPFPVFKNRANEQLNKTLFFTSKNDKMIFKDESIILREVTMNDSFKRNLQRFLLFIKLKTYSLIIY